MGHDITSSTTLTMIHAHPSFNNAKMTSDKCFQMESTTATVVPIVEESSFNDSAMFSAVQQATAALLLIFIVVSGFMIYSVQISKALRSMIIWVGFITSVSLLFVLTVYGQGALLLS